MPIYSFLNAFLPLPLFPPPLSLSLNLIILVTLRAFGIGSLLPRKTGNTSFVVWLVLSMVYLALLVHLRGHILRPSTYMYYSSTARSRRLPARARALPQSKRRPAASRSFAWTFHVNLRALTA